MKPLVLTSLALLVAGSNAAAFNDCDATADNTAGPFQVSQLNVTFDSTLFYVLFPTATADHAQFPVVGYMHGSTGQWGFYSENLRHVASHGFLIAFPFIKSPEKDKSPLTTNTDGKYLVKAMTMIENLTNSEDSPLFGLADLSNKVTAGHSMGATCSIMAAHTMRKDPTVKVAVAQHPGICGPIGPPPWPATWMKSDLEALTARLPVLLTTATNDGAFWPAPYTAEHEFGCFEGGVNGTAAFVQFSEAACTEDDAREPLVDDAGHDCPMKVAEGGRPEWPWVLTAMKLYAQHGGATTSTCYDRLWGNSTDDTNMSMRQSPDVDRTSLYA